MVTVDEQETAFVYEFRKMAGLRLIAFRSLVRRCGKDLKIQLMITSCVVRWAE